MQKASELEPMEMYRYHKRLELQLTKAALIDVNALYRKKKQLTEQDYLQLVGQAALIATECNLVIKRERAKGVKSDEKYIAYVSSVIRSHDSFQEWCVSRIDTIQEVNAMRRRYRQLQFDPQLLIGGSDNAN